MAVSLGLYRPRWLSQTAPAALDDAWKGLRWLAAMLAQVAVDSREVRPAVQLLLYPMLDAGTVTRQQGEPRDVRVWNAASNAWAWSAYLGSELEAVDASKYPFAAARKDLRGLPPAWVGVGTLDLFFDEDLAYAKRLNESGVACKVNIVRGAFHAFDVVFKLAPISKSFWNAQVSALKKALFEVQ